MLIRLASTLAFSVAMGLCADWNPRLASEYLDARQKDWFAWPAASKSGVPCVSCHTGVPYLLVRPVLGRMLGESQRTPFEKGLLDSLKSRVEKRDASQALGVESVLAALLLATESAQQATLSSDAQKAFDRMWSLQIKEGKARGAWAWFDLNLDPWETPDAAFYGAALAALATGTAPGGYQSRPDIQDNVAALRAYLDEGQARQPLHNRLILLWASAKLKHAIPESTRKAIAKEVWSKQQPDGGWTMQSLGGWSKHAVLERAGIGRDNSGLTRARDWLASHQDRQLGYWPAESMNKRYEPGSMPLQFMRDAATGFATLALLDAEQQP